ncbi:MAG: fatty acid desaturase [Pseudomonadota bacterium]
MIERLRAEGPTWAALVACYASYAALTLAAPAHWSAYVALAVVLAFHSSLQHEIIHGHPTRWKRVNEALVFPPLGFAFPFERYRDTHLAHHNDNRLTDPYDDPESWYVDPRRWAHLSNPARAVLRINNTVAGRMAIGPGLSLVSFTIADARRLFAGDRAVARAWALHGVGAALVLVWLWRCGVDPLGYALACYGGLSLINLRSFLEHRAEERVRGRSAIVEDRGPLALLYLNNNLHAVHHAHPEMPWAAIPAHYRAHKDRFLKMNGGYAFPSYWSVLRSFLFRPKEPVAHPLMPGPET